MLGAEIYTGMNKGTHSFSIDRGIALHKMIRLITFATANSGYLNFMGNEFGHPEWIDFPREGNNWSYQHARRQWSLADNNDLKYGWLGEFDKKMISLEKEYNIIQGSTSNKIYESPNDKIIAFTRGDLLFVFNFHPSNSFTGYGIPIQGKFRILFDSDQPEFGGFGRLNEQITYLSQRRDDHHSLSSPVMLYLYLPSRTSLVLKKVPMQSALDI
jgi:1,4-alpha-glucan branching enzyme